MPGPDDDDEDPAFTRLEEQEGVLGALFGRPPPIDQAATDHVIAALQTETDEPIPDVDACPKCGLSFVKTEQGAGLTFPIKVICTCSICAHEWERIDE